MTGRGIWVGAAYRSRTDDLRVTSLSLGARHQPLLDRSGRRNTISDRMRLTGGTVLN